MRLKCPGSGSLVQNQEPHVTIAIYTCPTCNGTFAASSRGRLRTHSSYPKYLEDHEARTYRINRRTGKREAIAR